VGYRLTKFILAATLLISGVWIAVEGFDADNMQTLPECLSGLVLFLAGMILASRKMESFNLFRIAVGGVIGCLAVRFIGDAVVSIMNAPSLEMNTAEFVSSIIQIVASVVMVAVYYYCLWAESNIHRVMENIFSIPELLGKLVFTIGLLAIYRIGFHVPLPGVNQEALKELAQQQSGGLFGQAMEYFSMFTGGSLSQSTLFGLGIMPYISASIIFTLLANVLPALEKLQKEGPAGQKKIQEYTRYAAVALCLVQGTFFMNYMMRGGGDMHLIYPEFQGSILIFMMGVIGLTAGTIFLMWLGEQIDEYGIGNGISLLIMAGIVVRMPGAIGDVIKQTQAGDMGLEKIVFMLLSFFFVVAGAILITQGQRRIPVQQAKQTRGRRVYGGQRHYMPLRVNHGGVMPIIFASSLMIFPDILFGWIHNNWTNEFTRTMSDAFSRGTWGYTVFYTAMIFFFAYFWTTVSFRPKDMADQLSKQGHFIPGLRPGKRTADYLERVMERITYCGAAFLAIIAVLPDLIATKMGIPWGISSFLGGTGLLIMVSVTLDLVQRIEANLVMRNYGGFLGGNTRIKGAQG